MYVQNYTEFIEISKIARDNLTDAEHKALEELSKDNTIVITKADKSNAVVIQNKVETKYRPYSQTAANSKK